MPPVRLLPVADSRAASSSKITKEAKIAKGTVYLYFRSRSEVYKAVFDHDMKALKQGCWLKTAIPCTTKLRFFSNLAGRH